MMMLLKKMFCILAVVAFLSAPCLTKADDPSDPPGYDPEYYDPDMYEAEQSMSPNQIAAANIGNLAWDEYWMCSGDPTYPQSSLNAAMVSLLAGDAAYSLGESGDESYFVIAASLYVDAYDTLVAGW
jgi:hypothetical protein